jgi:hypothetical protein
MKHDHDDNAAKAYVAFKDDSPRATTRTLTTKNGEMFAGPLTHRRPYANAGKHREPIVERTRAGLKTLM